MEETLATLTIPARTLVHICGWPVEVTADTQIESSAGNIELVTRDLYLRKNDPLPNTGSGDANGNQ